MRGLSYRIKAFRSLSLCRAYDVMELRREPMYWGPYKRLKFVKQKAAELRKERTLVYGENLKDIIDVGPVYAKVLIIEEPTP